MEAHEVEAYLDTIIKFNLKDFVDENGDPKPLHELTPEQAVCVKELGVIETQIGVTNKFLNFTPSKSVIIMLL